MVTTSSPTSLRSDTWVIFVNGLLVSFLGGVGFVGGIAALLQFGSVGLQAVGIAIGTLIMIFQFWRMSSRRGYVEANGLVLRTFWATYHIPFDKLRNIFATEPRLVGRLATWGWVLVTFSDKQGSTIRVVVSAHRGGQSLGSARLLWEALPIEVRFKLPEPLLRGPTSPTTPHFWVVLQSFDVWRDS